MKNFSKKYIIEADKAGVIKYFGFSKNVKEFMVASKCIVLPTYGEGMSNTLMEAASLECPLLASNVNGCKEIVDHEINGFLFEKKSVPALVDAMNKFLSLSEPERKRMGELGRLKMIKEFEKSIVVSSYLEEIEMLIFNKNQNN